MMSQDLPSLIENTLSKKSFILPLEKLIDDLKFMPLVYHYKRMNEDE